MRHLYFINQATFGSKVACFVCKRWHIRNLKQASLKSKGGIFGPQTSVFHVRKCRFVVSKPYCKGPCLRRFSFYSDVFQFTYWHVFCRYGLHYDIGDVRLRISFCTRLQSFGMDMDKKELRSGEHV